MKKPIVYCATLLFVLSALQISAQVSGASLTGLVTDGSGAVVPDARVTAVNVATGVETSASTQAGYYTFPALPVGTYEIQVEKSGFRKARATVTLETAERARQ